MKIAGYEIVRCQDGEPIGPAPLYKITRPHDGGPLAGVPVGWADSEAGAAAMALGGAYVAAQISGSAADIEAAGDAVVAFVEAARRR